MGGNSSKLSKPISKSTPNESTPLNTQVAKPAYKLVATTDFLSDQKQFREKTSTKFSLNSSSGGLPIDLIKPPTRTEIIKEIILTALKEKKLDLFNNFVLSLGIGNGLTSYIILLYLGYQTGMKTRYLDPGASTALGVAFFSAVAFFALVPSAQTLQNFVKVLTLQEKPTPDWTKVLLVPSIVLALGSGLGQLSFLGVLLSQFTGPEIFIVARWVAEHWKWLAFSHYTSPVLSNYYFTQKLLISLVSLPLYYCLPGSENRRSLDTALYTVEQELFYRENPTLATLIQIKLGYRFGEYGDFQKDEKGNPKRIPTTDKDKLVEIWDIYKTKKIETQMLNDYHRYTPGKSILKIAFHVFGFATCRWALEYGLMGGHAIGSSVDNWFYERFNLNTNQGFADTFYYLGGAGCLAATGGGGYWAWGERLDRLYNDFIYYFCTKSGWENLKKMARDPKFLARKIGVLVFILPIALAPASADTYLQYLFSTKVFFWLALTFIGGFIQTMFGWSNSLNNWLAPHQYKELLDELAALREETLPKMSCKKISDFFKEPLRTYDVVDEHGESQPLNHQRTPEEIGCCCF